MLLKIKCYKKLKGLQSNPSKCHKKSRKKPRKKSSLVDSYSSFGAAPSAPSCSTPRVTGTGEAEGPQTDTHDHAGAHTPDTALGPPSGMDPYATMTLPQHQL